ncbi:MAG: exopolyphosphatase [Bacillota bacterium]
MNNLAVIDIGSNSIKLVLAEVQKNFSFKLIDELKETVRLGEGMAENSYMKEDRMKVGLKTIKMFKNLCDATNTDDIIAVATAAVRNADNKDEFLNKIKKETGLEVKVLSGQEEGYYDYWGVANSIQNQEGLIMDIGGGSVELIWMKDKKVKESVSLPFGALTVTQKFDLFQSINSEKEDDLKDFLFKNYDDLNWIKKVNNLLLIGVGGTIRNIAKINKRKKDYPLDKTHYYKMKDEEVFDVYNLVKKKSLEERKNINGLSTKRADIFIGASALVSFLMKHFEIKNLLISGKGIREGLIYNYIYESKNPVDDVIDFSIQNVMHNYNLNIKHAKHIHLLTKSLFRQLKDLFSFDLNDFKGNINNIIKVSCMFHDIGTKINYYDHHEHSFYMIINSDINGLNHRELLISAFIAASHRHTKYSLKKYNLNRASFKKIISKNGKDKEVIRKIGLLLELAESFDRSMKGIVTDLDCSYNKNTVKIKAISEEDIDLEINDALDASKGFKKLFGKNLKISQARF